MKQIKLFFFLLIIVSSSGFGQNGSKCISLLINDSLFNQAKSSTYNLDILTDNTIHNALPEDIKDINQFVSIHNDCLKFRISFACGCGTNESKLVSDGVTRTDSSGKIFYYVKFIFSNHNNMCKAMCHLELAYDLAILKQNNSTEPVYIKFGEFSHLIRYY